MYGGKDVVFYVQTAMKRLLQMAGAIRDEIVGYCPCLVCLRH